MREDEMCSVASKVEEDMWTRISQCIWLSESISMWERRFFCTFIDLEKAYVRVNRNNMWDVLRENDINEQMLGAEGEQCIITVPQMWEQMKNV